MTVLTDVSREIKAGNGVTTAFPFTIVFAVNSDIVVTHVDAVGAQTAWVEGSHYTLTGAGSPSGGTLTTTAGNTVASGATLVIVRASALTQLIDFIPNSALPANTLEAGLDKLTRLIQERNTIDSRSLRLSSTDPASGINTLPTKTTLASKFLAFDGNGDPIAAAGTSANLTPVSVFINTLLDDVDAAAARATLLMTNLDYRGRNGLANSNFDIWQRGTSFSAGTGARYLADRWRNSSTGTTHAPSRQSFTLGQSAVPYEPQYHHRVDVVTAAGASNFAILSQRIEGVRSFAGRTVTLSFWAKAGSALPMSVEFVQNFGTGGSPSADVTAIGVTKVTLSTSFQQFTVTAAIPSIAGKVLGTSPTDHLEVIFWFDAGSNFNARTSTLGQQSGTFDIAQVQVEDGSVFTNYERVFKTQDLMRCQRYYQPIPVPIMGAALTAALFRFVYIPVVPFRASPAWTLGGAGQNIQIHGSTSSYGLTDNSQELTASSVGITLNKTSGAVIAADYLAYTGEVLGTLSAEL